VTEPVAILEDVHHCYGGTVALSGLSLAVRPGEILAVLGPNGAGKTTSIHLLLGLLPVQRGRVRVLGDQPGSASVRARRGAMLQVAGLPPTLRVEEQLDLFRSYYPRPLPAEQLVALAGLGGLERRRFDQLSGGQKRRVLFALALAGDPELLFLDEPTTGLDLESRRQLWTEVRRLAGSGRTLILTTHYLEEADALADRVAVIDRGVVIAEGSPAEIKARTAGRRIRCRTQVPLEVLRGRPEVAACSTSGQHVEILTAEPEALLRFMLSEDDSLTDLAVSGAGLEEAFLALTGGDREVA